MKGRGLERALYRQRTGFPTGSLPVLQGTWLVAGGGKPGTAGATVRWWEPSSAPGLELSLGDRPLSQALVIVLLCPGSTPPRVPIYRQQPGDTPCETSQRGGGRVGLQAPVAPGPMLPQCVSPSPGPWALLAKCGSATPLPVPRVPARPCPGTFSSHISSLRKETEAQSTQEGGEGVGVH